MQEKNIELEHPGRMKSALPANMSHDLRSPLNAIIGFSEALRDGLMGEMSDIQREYIGEIFTSGQQLLSLVNVLDSSEVEAGAPAQAAAILPRGAGTAVKAAAGRKQRTALVVEDNDQSAELLRLLLEAEGFTVLRAFCAEDAVLMASKQALALITLDLQLYEHNGWQFLKEIRENSSLARVPVVIISGQDVSEVALTRGAAAALQKPISRAQLKASLAKMGLISN